MKRIYIILAPVVALASPAVAASTPGELVQELAESAHNGDMKGFLANMSADTQRAMADAEATGSKLLQAQRDILAALDERFGERLQGQEPIIADRKTTLSRFVNIELIGVEQKTSNEARLRLKTITKGSGGRIATEEDTFSAVEESGEWKLELTDLARGLTQTAAQRMAAYAQVAQEVRSGAFKDRSAWIMLLKAQRRRAGSTGK